jgi:hypothetical protein
MTPIEAVARALARHALACAYADDRAMEHAIDVTWRAYNYPAQAAIRALRRHGVTGAQWEAIEE